MFYCVLHNWHSSESPCPACFPIITETLTTSASGTSDEELNQQKKDKPQVLSTDEYDKRSQPKEDKPEWEIVLMADATHNKFEVNKNGMFIQRSGGWGEYSSDYILKNGGKILQVKRLNDDLTFSVDEITADGRITSFEKYNDLHIRVWFENNRYVWFHTLEKSKPKEELKEPERIIVSHLGFNHSDGVDMWYGMGVSRAIPEEKFPAIKQAIEQVLNDDNKPYHFDKEILEKYPDIPMYSQSQVNKTIEDTAIGFIHYTEFIMGEDDWLKNGEMKSMYEVYQDFTQWKNSKKSSLK